jgi:photosystem II stability/assembly factor-like uncharacterized protein
MKFLALLILAALCVVSVPMDSVAKHHPKKTAKVVKKKKSLASKKHKASKKHSHATASHMKDVKSKIVMPSDQHPISVQKNYPAVGSSGEDRNLDWYYKRAFPNEFIDPDAYPNALAQARKLPIYGKGKFSTMANDQWQQIGPYSIGGRITSLATHPTDSNTFYAGAAAGGLWKTTDHGHSWVSLTDTFSAISVGCITIDPHDGNTVYIGMGECNGSADSYPGNGLWRSLDGGQSWKLLGLEKSQYISKVIVDPTDKNIIYAALVGPNKVADSNRGVWKSIDYGATWSRVLLVRSNPKTTTISVTDLAMNPIDHNDIVAALLDKYGNDSLTGLWRTIDGGGSWKRIDGLSPSYPNGATEKRLGRTSIFWANTPGTPTLYSVMTKTDVNAITGSATDENLFGVFKTTDPEGTWIKLIDSTYRIPYKGNNVDSADLFYRQGGYNNFLVGHPTRPNEIYVGGIDVIRTTDGGTSWTNITNAYPAYFSNDRTQHSDQHSLAFTCAASGDDLLNGQDGGVFNTRDYGKTWNRVEGLPITMFYHLEAWSAGMASQPVSDPNTLKLFGGTQDNGSVAKGFSSNPDWDWINRGDGGFAQEDPNNKNHLITSLQLGKIFFRTTLDSLRPNLFSDAGNLDPNAKKWFDLSIIAKRRGLTDSTEPCSFIPPVILDKQRGNEVFSGKTRLYRAKLSFSDPDSLTVIQPWSPQLTGVTNNPKQWFYGGDVEAVALGPRDPNGRPMIWMGGMNSTRSANGQLSGATGLWRTAYDPSLHQDSMPNWIKITTGLPFGIVSSIVCDRSDSLTAFASMTSYNAVKHLYKTINGGKNWLSISGTGSTALPNAPLNAFVIDSLAENGDPSKKNQCIIVAMDVGVFVTTDGGKSWAQLGEGLPNLVVGSLTMYKNWLIAGTHGRSAWALDVSGLQAKSGVERQYVDNTFKITSISPNPAKDVIKVTLEGNTTQSDVKLEFIDMNGNTILRSNARESQSSVTIPAEVPSGTYMLRAIGAAGQTAEEKVQIVK